jgi:hypothetical protein
MLKNYAQLASGDSVSSWQQKQYRQHAQTQISDSRQISAQMTGPNFNRPDTLPEA